MSSPRILQNARSVSIRLTAKRNFVTLPLARTSLALNKRVVPSLLSSYAHSINTGFSNKRFLNNKTTDNEIFKVVDFNDIQTLIKKEGKGYELIDVREEKEVVQGVIPTAKNVPLSQFANAWTLSDTEFKNQFGFEKPKKEDLVILYCLGGVRSTKAAEYLYSLGYDNLENYIGSWADYVEQIKKQA